MHDDIKLSPEEIIVLGSLIEKSKTTPDYYPMTLNAITTACNQKSSRKPVVDYSDETVLSAINSLKGRSLVATAVGGTARTIKYKHNFATVFDVNDAELAILCLLFLRGPQTPGEINTNSGRLHEFSSLHEVLETLNKLSSGEISLVKELTRRAGQKEKRFVHLFSDFDDDQENFSETVPSNSNLEERVTQLEKELAEMKLVLDKITKELF